MLPRVPRSNLRPASDRQVVCERVIESDAESLEYECCCRAGGAIGIHRIAVVCVGDGVKTTAQK